MFNPPNIPCSSRKRSLFRLAMELVPPRLVVIRARLHHSSIPSPRILTATRLHYRLHVHLFCLQWETGSWRLWLLMRRNRPRSHCRARASRPEAPPLWMLTGSNLPFLLLRFPKTRFRSNFLRLSSNFELIQIG